MTSHGYLFHGLNLTITGGAEVQAALGARLGQFPSGRLQGRPDLRFDFVKMTGSQPVVRPAGVGRPILEVGAGEVVYFDDLEQLYLDFPGCGRSLCDVRNRHATVWYSESAAADAWLLSHPFFTISLTELLKREGLFMVHAAGLAVGRKGLLLAGDSGSGKTTLTLMLVRAGFGFLADDTVFLSASVPGEISRGLRVLAFPDEAGVTEQTAGFFAELQSLPGRPPPGGRNKKPLGVAQTYGVKPCWECEPAVLVLDEPTSDLDPRGRREFKALLREIPATKLIATHDLELAVELCARAIILDQGQIIADGCTVELLADEKLMFAHGLERPHILHHIHPH